MEDDDLGQLDTPGGKYLGTSHNKHMTCMPTQLVAIKELKDQLATVQVEMHIRQHWAEIEISRLKKVCRLKRGNWCTTVLVQAKIANKTSLGGEDKCIELFSVHLG
jgi:hypothetical protein